MAPTVGYWDCRGIAAPITYLLEYVGEKYQHDKYDLRNRESWFSKKQSMGLKFPNLPYYIDGDVKLTQSGAILRHLARRHGLIAKTDKELDQQDTFDGINMDLQWGWGMLKYTAENIEEDKKKYLEDRFLPVLKQLDNHLSDKQYVLGDKLTYTDFVLFERLDGLSIFYGPSLLDGLPALKKFHQNMGNLKGVKEYRSSPRFNKVLQGPPCKWNNDQ